MQSQNHYCAYCYNKMGGKNFDHCKQCSDAEGKSYEYIVVTKSIAKQLRMGTIQPDTFDVHQI